MDYICFFDTETNGKPRSWQAPMKNVDNWPRVTQLAWRVVNRERQLVSSGNYLIKPDGWVIPVEQFFIDHNMNTERCELEGMPAWVVLNKFVSDLQAAQYLVAHNMNFDYNVLGAEMIRYKVSSQNRPFRICTMVESTNYCRIPHAGRTRYGSSRDQSYKWPKMEELHLKLFGRDFDNKHDAWGDLGALEPCFFELVDRGVIRLKS